MTQQSVATLSGLAVLITRLKSAMCLSRGATAKPSWEPAILGANGLVRAKLVDSFIKHSTNKQE